MKLRDLEDMGQHAVDYSQLLEEIEQLLDDIHLGRVNTVDQVTRRLVDLVPGWKTPLSN